MSTPEEAALLMLKGAISDLTDEQKKLVDQYYTEFKIMLNASESDDDGCALVAFSLIGAEMAAST